MDNFTKQFFLFKFCLFFLKKKYKVSKAEYVESFKLVENAVIKQPTTNSFLSRKYCTLKPVSC